MKKSNDLLENFFQKQRDFGYLESISLSRNLGEGRSSGYYVNIVLSEYPFYEGNNKLLLTFSDVQNISINNLEGLYKLLINISDVSENQMDGINYKVREEENELFSFYSKTFEFKIIS